MFDWNHNGKTDPEDYAFNMMILDDLMGDDDDDDGATGCCGPTVAMFLIGLILPVIVTAVFISH